jgi:FkbM family methyltransferase
VVRVPTATQGACFSRVQGMYDKFNWTNVAEKRNSILRQYEPLQLFLLYEFSKFLKIENFIDVGANIGAYSIVISSLECVKDVYAFEPSPLTFLELTKNIAINDCAKNKVISWNKAVSDTPGEVTFGIVDEYSGANSIANTSIHGQLDFREKISVERIPLDDILHYRSKTICLKIDVEGHENEVLVGARNLLLHNKAIVQAEDYSKNELLLQNLMRTFGYEKILSIGPDNYFTNCRETLSDEVVIRIFENAARDLIDENFDNESLNKKKRGSKAAIKIELLQGLNVEIFGELAGFMRRIRSALKAH